MAKKSDVETVEDYPSAMLPPLCVHHPRDATHGLWFMVGGNERIILSRSEKASRFRQGLGKCFQSPNFTVQSQIECLQIWLTEGELD